MIVVSDGDGNPRFTFRSDKKSWDNYSEEGIGRFAGPSNDPISVADDGTVTLTAGTAGACLIHVYDVGVGDGAVFFATFRGQTVLVTESLDNTHGFSISDSDGNYCVFKSNNNHTVTFKNRTGATRNMVFLITSSQVFG